MSHPSDDCCDADTLGGGTLPRLPARSPLPRFTLSGEQEHTSFSSSYRPTDSDTSAQEAPHDDLTSLDVHVALSFEPEMTTRNYPSSEFESVYVARTLPDTDECQEPGRRWLLGDSCIGLTKEQKGLTSFEEDDREERANAYYRLGRGKWQQGQIKQAVYDFEKALAIDYAHRATLEAMVAICEGLSDWKQVCAYRRQILSNVFDNEERFLMLNEIGDIWSDREKNYPKAIAALEEALELKSDNHVLLHKLLKLYQQAKNTAKMVETIQSISEFEPNPERKARYLYTMAQLYRDQQQLDLAVELFDESLDLNPDCLDAFERINKILTAQRNWKQLERSFRKMIHRVAGSRNTDLEFDLWYDLGLVYRERLDEVEKAVDAFRMASRIKPEDLTVRQILAGLHEKAGQLDLAIEEQQEILRREPTQAAPYRALFHLYYRKQAYDEAWCMCAALTSLRRADEDQQRFFEDYPAESRPRPATGRPPR